MILKSGPEYELTLACEGWRPLDDESGYFWAQDWNPTPPAIQKGTWSTADLRSVRGHWALIDLRGTEPILVVDRQRTRPLLAGKVDDTWHVTDYVETLREVLPFDPNASSVEAFRHFGFTLSNTTLIERVFDTEAGTCATLGRSSKPVVVPYFRYRVSPSPLHTQDEFSANFEAAMDEVFGRLLAQVGDRQLVVPLSAGLDSRLILTWLRRHNVENVLAFSYGLADAPERAVATAVAEALDYRFEFVEQTVDIVRDEWLTGDPDSFLRHAWGGTSLPHKQDWYAIKKLRATGAIESGAVLLPGHSVPSTGESSALYGTEPDIRTVAPIASRIGPYQGRPEALLHNPAFAEAMGRAASQSGFMTDARGNLSLWQWFNLRERQAKYISNSVRVYEHFGLGWALPLMEPEIWDARGLGSDALIENRAGYRNFVQEAFSAHAPHAKPARSGARSAPETMRSRILSSVRDTTTLRSLRQVRQMFRNFRGTSYGPYGYEGYSPLPTFRERLKTLGDRRTSIGRECDVMLEGRSGIDFSPFDSDN